MNEMSGKEPAPPRALEHNWTNWADFIRLMRWWSNDASMAEFSRLTHFPRTSISRWEYGVRRVPALTRLMIANAVHMDADERRWLDEMSYPDEILQKHGSLRFVNRSDIVQQNELGGNKPSTNGETVSANERERLVGAFIERNAAGPLSDAEAVLWGRLLVGEVIVPAENIDSADDTA